VPIESINGLRIHTQTPAGGRRASRLPDARVQLLATFHHVHREVPERPAEAILEFPRG